MKKFLSVILAVILIFAALPVVTVSARRTSDDTIIRRLQAVSDDVEFPSGVERLHWRYVRNLISSRYVMRVFDVYTGITYYVRSLANGNHADVEPLTAHDTALWSQTFGGVHTWNGRPVWVTIGGRTFAAAINGMPHDVSTISGNNMNGHLCLHFYGSVNNFTYRPFHFYDVEESVRAYELLRDVILPARFPPPPWYYYYLQHAISPQIRVDGEFVYIPYDDQRPIIVDGRTLVPLRAVMEKLGFEVLWHDETRSITLIRDEHNIFMQIGDLYMFVDGIGVSLDIPAEIVNGRTMVPVRAISEAADMEIGWDDENLIVNIVTPFEPPLWTILPEQLPLAPLPCCAMPEQSPGLNIRDTNV